MEAMTFEPRVFGVLLQYPDQFGAVTALEPFIANAHRAGVLVAVGADLLALALLKPPGEMGADVVSATRSGSVFRSATAVRTPHFSQRGTRTCGRHRAASSASPWTSWTQGVSHGAGDARAAYPSRESDIEHLHRAGAAREHGCDVWGLPWSLMA
jgi:hypothetical protein